MKDMTEKEYFIITRKKPEDDDLERVNCERAGKPGHCHCGFCWEHKQPRFICGCSLYPFRPHDNLEQ